MNDAGRRLRRGAHRTRHDPFRTAVAGGLTLLIAAGGLTLLAARSEPDTVRTTTAAGQSLRATPPAPATPTGPRPRAASPASNRPTTSRPAPSATGTSAAAREGVEVVVLNQTRVRVLGARAAALLRERGWTVVSVGNFRGTVSTTTVYHPAGQRAAAQAVAASLPGQIRVRERFANLSRTRLTLIVTEDFTR